MHRVFKNLVGGIVDKEWAEVGQSQAGQSQVGQSQAEEFQAGQSHYQTLVTKPSSRYRHYPKKATRHYPKKTTLHYPKKVTLLSFQQA